QTAKCSPQLGLEGVVVRRGLVLEMRNVTISEEGPEGTRVIATLHPQIDQSLTGERNSARSHIRVAVITSNGFARLVRVLRKWHEWNLIQVGLTIEVCSPAADIGNRRDGIPDNLVLHIKMPLLDVRPSRLCRNCIHIERKLDWR